MYECLTGSTSECKVIFSARLRFEQNLRDCDQRGSGSTGLHTPKGMPENKRVDDLDNSSSVLEHICQHLPCQQVQCSAGAGRYIGAKTQARAKHAEEWGRRGTYCWRYPVESQKIAKVHQHPWHAPAPDSLPQHCSAAAECQLLPPHLPWEQARSPCTSVSLVGLRCRDTSSQLHARQLSSPGYENNAGEGVHEVEDSFTDQTKL